MIEWSTNICSDCDPQTRGILIGAILAGSFSLFGIIITLLSQWFITKKQLAHDVETRERQFAHEMQQETRGRRTEALADLQRLLNQQSDALTSLSALYVKDSANLSDDNNVNKFYETLLLRQYREKLWATEEPVTSMITSYARASWPLLEDISEERVDDFGPLINGALAKLGPARQQLSQLMSEINGIYIPDDAGSTESE